MNLILVRHRNFEIRINCKCAAKIFNLPSTCESQSVQEKEMEEEDIDDDEKGEEEIQYRCVDVTEFSERALERGKMESDRMIEEQFGRLDENSSSSSASSSLLSSSFSFSSS